jgi:urease accessory protein UreE
MWKCIAAITTVVVALVAANVAAYAGVSYTLGNKHKG